MTNHLLTTLGLHILAQDPEVIELINKQDLSDGGLPICSLDCANTCCPTGLECSGCNDDGSCSDTELRVLRLEESLEQDFPTEDIWAPGPPSWF